MASLDQLKTALRNAEARGATQDAALLAHAIKERTPFTGDFFTFHIDFLLNFR